MRKRALPAPTVAAAIPTRPYCFISYSTREPHVALLIECCRLLFSKHYDVEVTPSGLVAGASQRDQITKLINDCTFGVVSLDGLRANIAFEYGMLHAKNKPVLLMKEQSAQVDIRGFFHDSANLTFEPVALNLDTQFSNVKDVNYATWSRNSFMSTMKTLHTEFSKRKNEIKPFIEIPEFTW